MKSLSFFCRYIKYYLSAKSASALHSPFIFKLYTEVISKKSFYPEYTIAEKRRKELLKDKSMISVLDMGAGSERKSESFRRVKSIVKRSSTLPSKGQLLFRLARYFNPEKILELGTSAGISTMYLALGSPKTKVITIEGCANIASVAEINFRRTKITNVEQNIGSFENLLPDILRNIGVVDMLFIDGDHRKERLLENFGLCMEYSGNESVFVIDDIHWSKSMEEAWKTISHDPRVKVSVDLFHFGLVFFREELSDESFILRF